MLDATFYTNVLFQIILFLYFLNVNGTLTKHQHFRFNNVLAFLFVLLLFHILYIIVNIGSPIGLLYGPLLYQSSLALDGKTFSRIHYIPYLFLSLMYFCYTIAFHFAISAPFLEDFYYPLYLFAMPLSISIYSLLIAYRHVKNPSDTLSPQHSFLSLLTVLSFCVSVPLFLFATAPFEHRYGGINLPYLIYLLLALAGLYIASYFYAANLNMFKAQASISKPDLDTNASAPIVSAIQRCLAQTPIYLDDSLTLQKLAQHINSSPQACSKAMNEHLGKNFYELLAVYRIAYAKKLIEEDIFGKLTLEHIARQSGFRSKSSFNRYFKMLEGCAPNAYRKSVESKSA
ncbi:AraC family transcriptional regulator [Olivibacter sp. XZL3]|uniref:helix-turn-helix domain-containing protein n=1 Tax=Olivibacter sp. XZL3 TaxID=1735116 RepID=UPI0010662BE9|nr:helix-turn-helix domain-containing protein [Olivibacter sp. XZL3]